MSKKHNNEFRDEQIEAGSSISAQFGIFSIRCRFSVYENIKGCYRAGFAVFRGDMIDRETVIHMINTGITKLLGTADAESAWKKLFRPNDIVGLKVNCLAGHGHQPVPKWRMESS